MTHEEVRQLMAAHLRETRIYPDRRPARPIADKWDRRFLELAGHVASWSKDPSTQTGAVIVRPDRSVASLGFNGFPRGMTDEPEEYAERELKYAKIVHCEMNALLSAREPVAGCALYTTGPSCDRCAVHMIQAGIRDFIFGRQPDLEERWAAHMDRTWRYFTEVNARVRQIDQETWTYWKVM